MNRNSRRKIENDLISRLLRRVRRYVENQMWDRALVWYPTKARKQISADTLASGVLPDEGTPQFRVFQREFSRYLGRQVNSEQMYQWLRDAIEERIWSYIIGARTKINKVQMHVTKRKVEIQALRPETTSCSVGPTPWTEQKPLSP